MISVTRDDLRRLSLHLLCLLLIGAHFVYGESEEDRRELAGVRLFRALLAADTQLNEKVGADGKLLLLFFCTDNSRHAQDLASAFTADPIRDLPIQTEITADPTFKDYSNRVPAGIFIAQSPNSDTLQKIIHYGIDRRIIIYSPFEGHVEKGVLGGLSVGAQVRPYVNMSTVEASHILLKSFFLKVAKVYQ